MQINQSINQTILTQITMLERSIAELNKRLALIEVKQDIIQDDMDDLEVDCCKFYGHIKSGR